MVMNNPQLALLLQLYNIYVPSHPPTHSIHTPYPLHTLSSPSPCPSLGAHSLIPEGRDIPDRSLVMGSPGKVVKTLTDEQVHVTG